MPASDDAPAKTAASPRRAGGPLAVDGSPRFHGPVASFCSPFFYLKRRSNLDRLPPLVVPEPDIDCGDDEHGQRLRGGETEDERDREAVKDRIGENEGRADPSPSAIAGQVRSGCRRARDEKGWP